VLGDMLGSGRKKKMHRRPGQQVADRLGSLSSAPGRSWPKERALGCPRSSATFSTSEEAAAGIAALIEEGDLILVKGSRGMRMERVVQRLMDEFKEN
jgi:UDP-N-acetylmuramoyl-tripeptide--D-alanyl-D-alanine ligase